MQDLVFFLLHCFKTGQRLVSGSLWQSGGPGVGSIVFYILYCGLLICEKEKNYKGWFAECMRVHSKFLQFTTQLCATPWTVAHQAPLSMGFSRQQYWSGLPFPSPGDLPDPGSKPCLLHWQEYSLPLSHFEVAKFTTELIKNKESCVATPKNWTKMHVLGSWNEPFLLQI